jgi:hypothetical protein
MIVPTLTASQSQAFQLHRDKVSTTLIFVFFRIAERRIAANRDGQGIVCFISRPPPDSAYQARRQRRDMKIVFNDGKVSDVQ